MSSTCEVACHPCYEVKSDSHYDESYYERTENISVGIRKNHHKDIEHTGKTCERQELVAWKYDGKNECYRNEKEGNYECSRVADNESWGHTDVELLVGTKLLCDEFFGCFSYWFQTFDEERCDARNEFHDCSHLDTNLQGVRNVSYDFIPVAASQTTDYYSDENSQKKWFAKESELLLHTFCVDIYLVDSWNIVKNLVDDNSKRHETLTEWLWNADSVHARIELLKLLSCNVGKYEGDDVADDSCEESPTDRTSHEIDDSSDKCKVPVVPQVNVYCTSATDKQQEEVYSQTNRNDE